MKTNKNRLTIFLLVALALLLTTLIINYQKPSSPKISIKPLFVSADNLQAETATPLPAKVSPQPTPSPTPNHQVVLTPQKYGRSITVPILTYHYIGENPNPSDAARDNLSVTPSKFDAQMDYLFKQNYTPITLDTLYAGLYGTAPLPPRPVVLTFDDGYIDFYVNAFPILRKYGFRSVSFIPTGLVGTSYYMNWAQIKEIDSSGLVSFQAHSVNHSNLPEISVEEAKYQIENSKRSLEETLGKPVNFFAYPYGTSNPQIWQIVKNAGFTGAVGTWESKTISEGTIFDMPRVKIPGNITLEDFAKKL